jgi:hypothetical protein
MLSSLSYHLAALGKQIAHLWHKDKSCLGGRTFCWWRQVQTLCRAKHRPLEIAAQVRRGGWSKVVHLPVSRLPKDSHILLSPPHGPPSLGFVRTAKTSLNFQNDITEYWRIAKRKQNKYKTTLKKKRQATQARGAVPLWCTFLSQSIPCPVWRPLPEESLLNSQGLIHSCCFPKEGSLTSDHQGKEVGKNDFRTINLCVPLFPHLWDRRTNGTYLELI